VRSVKSCYDPTPDLAAVAAAPGNPRMQGSLRPGKWIVDP